MTFVHQDFVNKVCLAKNVGRAGLRDCRDMSIWKQPSQFAERGYTHHRITQPIWRAYDDAIDGGGVSIFHKVAVRGAGASQPRCQRSIKSNSADPLQLRSAAPSRGLARFWSSLKCSSVALVAVIDAQHQKPDCTESARRSDRLFRAAKARFSGRHQDYTGRGGWVNQ